MKHRAIVFDKDDNIIFRTVYTRLLDLVRQLEYVNDAHKLQTCVIHSEHLKEDVYTNFNTFIKDVNTGLWKVELDKSDEFYINFCNK